MNQGIYEGLINKLIKSRLDELAKKSFYIKSRKIDKIEASLVLSRYLFEIFKRALDLISKDDSPDAQIKLANQIIRVLRDKLDHEEFDDDIIDVEGRILKGIWNTVNSPISDFDNHIEEITPYTRLSQSELFTGGNASISLDSELRREILSSDRIDFLVSFIQWGGVVLLEPALRKFTDNGGKLRIITTTYVGATDAKAIHRLSELKNTEIKISYNTKHERVHAKAYLFFRESGFHTGYIGSSNLSKSALTKGLEWNLKITTKEVSHIIDKFQKTFDAYWEDREFELYNPQKDSEKLSNALKAGKFGSSSGSQGSVTFDLKPFPFQYEILEKLHIDRTIHGCYKNLIVAATGTGKTIISAFDYKRFKLTNTSAKLLFVAHRKEILIQAQETFQAVLKNYNFGELWADGVEPSNYEYVFASVQTLKNKITELKLSLDFYDFIIIDEVHHIAAASYRPILDKFKPHILLGLTATPERMDGTDILKDFGGRIAAEIRLPEALNQRLLCPFQYFGVSDSIDLTNVSWTSGKYDPNELTKLYTQNDIRVSNIIKNLDQYLKDKHDVIAIGFCVSKQHAQFMSEKFLFDGLKANYITSDTPNRETIKDDLKNKRINYLFVVDIFNEGVDIPEVNTVLFLRPTESLTIFLQQLGRGLRLSDKKEYLTVLDFVGNARPEYDFQSKFRALIGKTISSIQEEIEDDFPHLPLGCSILLEEKAKKAIIENIKAATSLNRSQLIQKIRNFKHQTNLPFSLKNFLGFYNIPIQLIYKRDCWARLLAEAFEEPFSEPNEKQIYSAIKKKWLSTKSVTYFKFILELAKKEFDVSINKLSDVEKTMCLMLYYDVWTEPGLFKNLEEGIKSIGKNKALTKEVQIVMELLIDSIDFVESEIWLPYKQPLKLHARYTREQILVAFKFSSFTEKSKNREGVAENKVLNTELLFVDLIKSEEKFSPTTMYNDYAITETLFHWQSQNAARPDKGKGLSYINHEKEGKKILLFVREQSKDEFQNTMGYVFIGEGLIQETHGAKPMNIKWKLSEPIPPYLWNSSAKLSIG